jgi:hypothetical protein
LYRTSLRRLTRMGVLTGALRGAVECLLCGFFVLRLGEGLRRQD